MHKTLLAMLAVAVLVAGCGVGDPAFSSDSRHTGHFGPGMDHKRTNDR